ncbi:hypothetical protein [Qipengyuania sp. MTN3-11]|uniref:hypothetical protein n=1 Tax=Qipengyuania sp. MTN3-11 TaxID=3056557 RepID=UPI0036F24F35
MDKDGADAILFAKCGAWTSGMPDAEYELWQSLDLDERRLAVKRISALLAYERDDDWRFAAATAQLGRSAFFSMAKKWAEDRSMASVIPKRRGKQARVQGELKFELRRQVRDLVQAHPDWTKGMIVQQVRRTVQGAPVAREIRPLVDEARVDAERSLLDGERGFGRRIVVAVCPAVLETSRPVADGSHRREAEAYRIVRILCVVVDAATGRVMGAAGAHTYRSARDGAVSAALTRLSSVRQGEKRWKDFEIEVRVADPDPVYMMGEIRRLAKTSESVRVVTEGARAQTNRLLELFAGNLGTLRLEPRADLTYGDDEDRDSEEFDDRLRDELVILRERSGPVPSVIHVSLDELMTDLTKLRDQEGA